MTVEYGIRAVDFHEWIEKNVCVPVEQRYATYNLCIGGK